MIAPDALVNLNTWTYDAVKEQMAGVTHEDSVRQPMSDGNCLNWVVGHIVAGRSNVLAMLGAPTVWRYADVKPYLPGSAPFTAGATAHWIECILTDLDQAREHLLTALRGVAPEALQVTRDDETLDTKLLSYGLHEAYHAGQVELLWPRGDP